MNLKPHYKNPHIKCNQNRRIRRANTREIGAKLNYLIKDHHYRKNKYHNARFKVSGRVAWKSNHGEIKTGVIIKSIQFQFGGLGLEVLTDPQFQEKKRDPVGILFASSAEPSACEIKN